LFGIELLLFFEDFAAAAFTAVRVSLTDARARLLVALRLTAAGFFETTFGDAFAEAFAGLETLFLRVFCDTACRAGTATPLFDV
jgi:hypothetical protein